MGKGGRKRKQGVAREKNGRANRVNQAIDNKSVVLNQRMQKLKLTQEEANRPECSTAIGFLLKEKHIKRFMYDAGVCYGLEMDRYYRLSGVPHPSPSALDYEPKIGGSGMGEESPQMQEAITKATQRVMEAETVLLCNIQGPKVKSTIYNVCLLNDYDCTDYTSIQIGLRALARHYGIPEGE